MVNLNKNPKKAYKDEDFLNGPEARSVRILSELLEPGSRLEQQNISDVIVFFGSARIPSPKRRAQRGECTCLAGTRPPR